MKKLLFLLFVGLLTLTSCDKPIGTVSGTVTYFYNDFIGYKPDVGATVYVSEYYDLSENYIILSDTTKGGISGGRKGSMVEYLSVI